MSLMDNIHISNNHNEEPQDSIKYQAKYDFLTNTLNRRSLINILETLCRQAKKENSLHAYLFLDLDKFKNVNDRYGHDTGDKLLVALVERIKPLLHKDDVLARMSGDEFAIILKNIDKYSSDGMRRINEVCVKISSELSRPFRLNQYEILTGVSIGVRVFPEDIEKSSDIIVQADVAMYRSKNKKSAVTIYDKRLAKEFENTTLLKEELEKAYKNSEYIFFFQPKVDVHTNKIKGVEILVRWQHPKRGLLYPIDFFKEAFDIGMISRITDLSIHQACEFISTTKEYYDGTISINVSSREIEDTFFISRLVAIIEGYGIDARRIELEITEDELIKNFDLAIILIKQLRELGIAVSMDDFGTGYSSITYLHKLPVDTMKIDKSFIQYLERNNESDRDWILLKTIASMAKAFNLKIIAEGVETQEQLSIVKSLGIDEYQGYLFSKAVNKETLLDLVKINSTS
jgi:diguanylate cyclase (GGDEF)-like protein